VGPVAAVLESAGVLVPERVVAEAGAAPSSWWSAAVEP
jgi:hypothetical protein